MTEDKGDTALSPTPLIEVEGVLAKLECVNPCGSIKDRIALYILRESERQGSLRPGMTIIEATSGNTGIAMAYYGRRLGYRVIIVMPEHMTEERKEIIRALGADLILSSREGSFAEAAQIRDEMAASDSNLFNPNQFGNPLNTECHRKTTGAELIEQARLRIDAFVAGVGTGGTVMGVGAALRAKWAGTHIAAVEPQESAVMTGGCAGTHSIFGIGDGFIPELVSGGAGGVSPMIDEVIVISSVDALQAAKDLASKHGICVGTSSGANFLAAKRLQGRFNTVATVFPDGAQKYRSWGLDPSAGLTCPFRSRCDASVIACLCSNRVR